MRRFTPVVAAAAIAAIQVACSGSGSEPVATPTAPNATPVAPGALSPEHAS